MPMHSDNYDVAILGGALSGTAMALLLKRERPETRIVIIEKNTKHDRKVGESTSEVAGCFLTKVLNLSGYLYREHVAKHGLRLWFTTPENDSMGKCSEIGGDFQPKLPGFQLDRAKLDAHLLELCEKEGVDLIRPASVKSFELGGVGENVIHFKTEGEEHSLRSKWLIDASGKASLLGRKRGTVERLEDHPTNAVWARFTNTADFDGHKLRAKFPECYGKGLHAPRGTATNHLMGRGWWCWIIPLSNGDVSAGLTWDPRIFTPPTAEEGGSLSDRLHAHLKSHPVGLEIFGEAVPVEKDTRTFSHLPYENTEVAGDGWAVVGDAAGFIDPLYSQGIDYIGFTVCAVKEIVKDSLDGACVADRVEQYREDYSASYLAWYRALYRDKYEYLGDAQLMYAAFLLDLACYFIGPVRLVYEQTENEFQLLPYTRGPGALVGRFMAFYNRRLVSIARKRHAAGTYGAENLGHRYIVHEGLSPAPQHSGKILLKGVAVWLRAEFGALFLPPVTAKLDAREPVAMGSPESN